MADTLSLGDGSTFNSSGQALNSTAQNSVATLTGNSQASSYNSYVPPSPTAPVSSSLLNGPSLSFPSAPTPDNGSSAVAGVVAGLNASNQPQSSTNPGSPTPSLDAAVNGTQSSDLQQNVDKSLNTYKADISNNPDESKMLASQEQAAGIPGQLDHIGQLKADLASTTAAYNNQYQQIGTQGVQNGIPSVFYQGEQAAQQRAASVAIAGKAAVLSAVQGNYQLAEAHATTAANMMFKAATDKIANDLNFLKLNESLLSNSQKAAIKANAGEQQVQIATQKANVKMALSNGVQSQFYTKMDGTVVRTNDGFEFSTPQQAQAAGVLPDFSNAPKINPVGKSETKTINGKAVHLTYDQQGNVMNSTTLGNAGKAIGTGTGNPLSAKAIAGAGNKIDSFFTGTRGSDGFVSPEHYSAARSAWAKDGLPVTKFDSQFSKYINPADKQDYQGSKVTPKSNKSSGRVQI